MKYFIKSVVSLFVLVIIISLFGSCMEQRYYRSHQKQHSPEYGERHRR